MNERSPSFRRLLNLIALVGWACLFAYSIYVLVSAVISGRTYTIFHIIAIFVLFLVFIRSLRRYISQR